MAGGGQTPPRDEEAEAVGEPARDLLERERLRPGGRELERERQAIQVAADPGRACEHTVVVLETRPRLAGPGQEEPYRLRGAQFRFVCGGRGKPERRHLVVGLAGHAQRLPARGQNPDPRAGGEEVSSELAAGLAHVLAVVEHEQQVDVAKMRDEPYLDRLVPLLANVEGACRLAGDERGIGETSRDRRT